MVSVKDLANVFLHLPSVFLNNFADFNEPLEFPDQGNKHHSENGHAKILTFRAFVCNNRKPS